MKINGTLSGTKNIKKNIKLHFSADESLQVMAAPEMHERFKRYGKLPVTLQGELAHHKQLVLQVHSCLATDKVPVVQEGKTSKPAREQLVTLQIHSSGKREPFRYGDAFYHLVPCAITVKELADDLSVQGKREVTLLLLANPEQWQVLRKKAKVEVEGHFRLGSPSTCSIEAEAHVRLKAVRLID